MQFYEGAKLRKEAKLKEKQCSHPDPEKEYYNELATGDYICTTCGETHWTKEEFYK